MFTLRSSVVMVLSKRIFAVVGVLSKGVFAVVGDRTGGPLLESGHYLPEGLEGRGLLLQEPA